MPLDYRCELTALTFLSIASGGLPPSLTETGQHPDHAVDNRLTKLRGPPKYNMSAIMTAPHFKVNCERPL